MGLHAFGGAHSARRSCSQHACLHLHILPPNSASRPTWLPLMKHLSAWTLCSSGQHALPNVQVYKGNWRHTDVAVKRFLEQDLSPQLMKVGATRCWRKLPAQTLCVT